MKDCRNEINKITNTNPSIIRFPGGSRKHLNNEFLSRLHEENFKIYDWNVQVSDGINPKLPSAKLFREATQDTDSIPSIILLMHCDYMHKNTCKALPEIIDYYKQHGYIFKAITEDTPELYFPLPKRTFKSIWDIMTSR
jgi:Predicted xylanase/chitin deacetylase